MGLKSYRFNILKYQWSFLANSNIRSKHKKFTTSKKLYKIR